MAIVNKFNVNKQQVTLDADIIENMSANDVSYDASTQYDDNTVGDKLNKLSELEKEVIYDVTTNNNGATFASLSALLSDENLSTLIPTSVRRGGMSIRFVNSSDNKYVQYILIAQDFTTDITQWQVLDNTHINYIYPNISKDDLYNRQLKMHVSNMYYTPERNIRRITGLSCMIRSNWVPTESAKIVAYKPNDIIVLREFTVKGGFNEFLFDEPITCDKEHKIALYLAIKPGDNSWNVYNYDGGVYYVTDSTGSRALIPQSQYSPSYSNTLVGAQFYNNISKEEILRNEIEEISSTLENEIEEVTTTVTDLKNKTFYKTDWEDCGDYDVSTNTILEGTGFKLCRVYLGGKSAKYTANTYLQERLYNIFYEKNGNLIFGCRFPIDNRDTNNWENVLIGNNGIEADAIVIHCRSFLANDTYFTINSVDIIKPEETELIKKSGLLPNESFISMPLGLDTWFRKDHSGEFIGIINGVQSYKIIVFPVSPNTTVYADSYTQCAELAENGMVIANHYVTSKYSFVTNENTKYIIEPFSAGRFDLAYSEEAFEKPYLIDTNITSDIEEITKYKAPSTYYIQEILKDYSNDYLKGRRILFNGDSFLHGQFVAENMYQFIQNKHPLSDVIFGGFSGRTMAYVPAVSGNNSVVNSLTNQVSLYAQTKSTLYYSLTSDAELTRSELNLVIFEGISAVDEVRLYNGVAATFFNICSYNETTGVITDLFVSGWNNEIGENHVYLGKTIHALDGECIAIRSSYKYIGSSNSKNLRYVADNEHTFKGRVDTTGEIVTIQGSPLVQVLCTNLHYCILQGGLNDMYNRGSIPIGTIIEGYPENGYDDATFIGALEHSFSKVIRGLPTTHLGFIIMPQGFDIWRDSYVTNIKAVCEKWGVAYLDYEKIIGTRCLNLPKELTREWWRTNPNGTDNGHPNQYMYDTMNTMLDKFIMEMF